MTTNNFWKEKICRLLICFLITCATNVIFAQDCSKSTVYFGLNERKTEKVFLVHVDSILQTFHPDTTYLFEIHGHTDSRGTEESNIELAKKRIAFIVNHVLSKQLPNVRLIEQNFGEKNPISNKHKENRRVNIYTTPINKNGTIVIKSPNGSRVNVPYNYFNRCGYCLAQPELKITKKLEDNFPTFGVRIESNCEIPINCISVEFRFPYAQFNAPSEIKIPRPIYFKACRRKYSTVKDSVFLDTNYYKQFHVSYDTLTDEYIVTHDCYNITNVMCPCLHQKPEPIRLYFPDSITGRKSGYFYKYRKVSTHEKIYDTTIYIGDTNYFQQYLNKGFQNYIIGMGYNNDRLLFLKIAPNQIEKRPVYDDDHLLLYYEHFIHASDYKPLKYLKSEILIKIPRNTDITEVGYYLESFDHFIPIENLKKNQYQHKILDSPYSFGVKVDGEIISVKYTVPKKKYKKRKRVLKVKIKRKHLYPNNS